MGKYSIPIPPTGEAAYFRTDGRLARVHLTAHIIVVSQLYLGAVRLVRIQGFRDESSGGITTKEIRTESVDMQTVEKTWKKVTEQEIHVKPLFRLSCADLYRIANDPEWDEIDDNVVLE